ncbi:uncharacterized protein I206_104111 [Kwoniella pini CBS 10737]|uniref:SUN domain-containing protein n=1 Tax=Kwoniella pini CBS 10737 TaxID=1296096 RepID=A0A1B9I2M4_9TREE|nr:uncharacterized protein I206_04313 [Kwoniella pini CBS 10737]OCF49787.1 hypothetical protein I206_04313 [Kwoniella pini CBS 10737]
MASQQPSKASPDSTLGEPTTSGLPDPSPLATSVPGHHSEVDTGISSSNIWTHLRPAENTCDVSQAKDEVDVLLNATTLGDSVLSTSVDSAPAKSTESSETFISFEDWKRIKQAEEEAREDEDEEVAAAAASSSELQQSSTTLENAQLPTDVVSNQTDNKNASNISNTSAQSTVQSKGKTENSTSSRRSSEQPSASPPPISHHNRYNYASPDCSARIHSSSPQTQHASSLLHKSRDRYMLTPCKAKEHWVVVELCDEIRIEAVEIAIWEFFSGVVRDVRISIGGEDDEEYEDDPADDVTGRSVKWKEVASFVGKNVRGVQTFTLSQPTSFHRFIRLDFPSYYGSEYYCPVSQLKVFGMNQMEAFKWEQKRINAASKGKNEAKEKEAEERRAKERAEKEQREKDEKEKQQEREKELDALEKLLHEQAGRKVPDILTETAILSKLQTTPQVTSSDIRSTSSSNVDASIPKSSASSINVSQIPASSPSLDNVSSEPTQTAQVTSKTSTDYSSQASSSSSSTYARSSPPRTDSSESIYAFIIRRLNDLEGNSTLVARYIEEQAKVMRHMLTRVEKGWDGWKGEDRGRWEQERMRQEDRLGKVISQLEQQRSAFEEERRTLQSQMRGLAEELGYERRRGLAQMFVMFIIIFLGFISRSSTIDAVLKPLLAEAKRRRSIYGGKSFSGPLTGLRIDMGEGRPPAVIGQGRPKNLSDFNDDLIPQVDSPTSSTLTPISTKSYSRSLGKNNSIKRSGTPRQRKLPPGVNTNFRSISSTDYLPINSSTYTNTSESGMISPEPRGSLSSSLSKPNGGPLKKLSRTSHLHILDSNLNKLKSKSPRSINNSTMTSPVNGNSPSSKEDDSKTPKKFKLNQQFQNNNHMLSDLIVGGISPFTVQPSSIPDQINLDDGPSDWGTDVETETSVSEIENEIENVDDKSHEEEEEEGTNEMIKKELSEIWNNP